MFERHFSVVLLVCVLSSPAIAGTAISSVQKPYVNLDERELEYQLIAASDEGQGSLWIQRLGFGTTLAPDWFIEFELEGEQGQGQTWAVDGLALELRWQLSEQGEFDHDWGMLFEIERDLAANTWEVSSQLLFSHQWGRYDLSINPAIVYEWGPGVRNEWETGLDARWAYRYKRELEPGIELYMSDSTRAIGPVLRGQIRGSGRQQWLWESGLLFGYGKQSSDVNVKFVLEYEF